MNKTVASSGIIALLSSGVVHAVEKSDFSVVSLHTAMLSYFDLSRDDTMVSVAGFTAFAAVIAYRLFRRKRVPSAS